MIVTFIPQVQKCGCSEYGVSLLWMVNPVYLPMAVGDDGRKGLKPATGICGLRQKRCECPEYGVSVSMRLIWPSIVSAFTSPPRHIPTASNFPSHEYISFRNFETLTPSTTVDKETKLNRFPQVAWTLIISLSPAISH